MERRLNESQLQLLFFALNNTKLDDETDNAVKVTITKRAKHLMNNSIKVERSRSCML